MIRSWSRLPWVAGLIGAGTIAAALAGAAAPSRAGAPEAPGPATPTASSTPAAAGAPPYPYRDRRLAIDRRVADLLGRMTLPEKLGQLYLQREDNRATISPAELLKRHPGGVSAVGRAGLKRGPRDTALFANAVQRALRDGTRLGIPALFIDEALHGLMNQGSTSFPQAIALASTWDPALVRQLFGAAAREMRARGSNWALTPVLDLARDPRWGRTEETYGEDPYLVSRIGVAAIQGLQGTPRAGGPIDRQHVLATAKHFAAHGQPEGGSNAAPANYSERILREQFLVPFQAAVTEAGVGSVMASYNEIDGVPSHVNHWLLSDLLRGEWRFGGFVTSDGGGIDELVKVHHVAHDRAEAARRALAAGIDYELGDAFSTLAGEVGAGRVGMAAIDGAVARVLTAKFRLGLFDDPLVDPDAADRLTNSPDHQALALRAAREAIILLQNRAGLLPLDRAKIRSIAVLGPNADQVHLGGYSVDPGRGVSILDGIRRKLGAGVTVTHAEGCRITAARLTWQGWWEDRVEPPDRSGEAASIAEAARLAKAADVALVVVGENEATSREGWAANHLGDRDSLDLLGGQSALVQAVVATGTPTVVFLINGRPLSIPEVAAAAPAILEGFYLGQETGTAVADVLFGDVNPGGKLPISVPRSVGQLPVYYYQKPSARRGYLWSDKEPLYPFGHGLSYTRFAYSDLRVSPSRIARDGRAEVSVTVSNAGRRSGDEVVQLYVHDRESSVTRPVQELKGFQRITLAAGERRTVRFALGPAELSMLDLEKKRVVEPGLFDLRVGGSSVAGASATLEVK
jgi:beta-glucosidase